MNRGSTLRALEFLLLIPATFLLAPFLLYGTVKLIVAMFGIVTGTGSLHWKAFMVKPMLLLVVQMLAGLASLAGLWILALGGRTLMQRWPYLRGPGVILLVIGEADAARFLFWKNPRLIAEIASSAASVLIWTIMLLFPMLLGLWYLYVLLTQRD